MTKGWKNRKRWALRRALILHERTLDKLWLEVAAFEGRKEARLAALPVHLMALNEIETNSRREGRPEADALILAQIGVLR